MEIKFNFFIPEQRGFVVENIDEFDEWQSITDIAYIVLNKYISAGLSNVVIENETV